MPRNGDPDSQENRDGLLSIPSLCRSTNRQLIMKQLLQRSLDLVSRFSSEEEFSCLLEPFQPNPLTKSDLHVMSHASTRSMRTNGTINSSREIPPCPTIRSPSCTKAERPGAMSGR